MRKTRKVFLISVLTGVTDKKAAVVAAFVFAVEEEQRKEEKESFAKKLFKNAHKKKVNPNFPPLALCVKIML